MTHATEIHSRYSGLLHAPTERGFRGDSALRLSSLSRHSGEHWNVCRMMVSSYLDKKLVVDTLHYLALLHKKQCDAIADGCQNKASPDAKAALSDLMDLALMGLKVDPECVWHVARD